LVVVPALGTGIHVFLSATLKEGEWPDERGHALEKCFKTIEFPLSHIGALRHIVAKTMPAPLFSAEERPILGPGDEVSRVG
jgi:hypothetical protein